MTCHVFFAFGSIKKFYKQIKSDDKGKNRIKYFFFFPKYVAHLECFCPAVQKSELVTVWSTFHSSPMYRPRVLTTWPVTWRQKQKILARNTFLLVAPSEILREIILLASNWFRLCVITFVYCARLFWVVRLENVVVQIGKKFQRATSVIILNSASYIGNVTDVALHIAAFRIVHSLLIMLGKRLSVPHSHSLDVTCRANAYHITREWPLRSINYKVSTHRITRPRLGG